MNRLIITYLLLILALTGCDKQQSPLPEGNINSNTDTHKYAKRIEMPALNDEDIFMTHTTTVNGKEHVTYSISHNPERKHCRWTAFTFDPSNRDINWDRDNWGRDPFQPTPGLEANAEMTSREIWNEGGSERFVRGHIVASYDRVYSKDANEQTFFFSNISPMYSKFNTGAWNDCERVVQQCGRSSDFCDTLYIVKGATIREGEFRTVERCPTVPNYYFMALLKLYKKSKYEAIGLLFKHVNGKSKTEICSIDHLEEFTGIDFFCNIPDHVENSVETMYRPEKWSGLSNYTDLGK